MSIKQDGSAVGLCPPAASERQEGAAYRQAAAQQPARQKSPARVLDAGPRVRKGAGATYRGHPEFRDVPRTRPPYRGS